VESTWTGSQPDCHLRWHLTAAKLRVILEQHFVFNLAATTGEPEGPYRSLHNDPRYRSATVTSLQDSVGVQDAGQPPSSPEMNAVENIWCILNEKVQRRQPADKPAFVGGIGRVGHITDFAGKTQLIPFHAAWPSKQPKAETPYHNN